MCPLFDNPIVSDLYGNAGQTRNHPLTYLTIRRNPRQLPSFSQCGDAAALAETNITCISPGHAGGSCYNRFRDTWGQNHFGTLRTSRIGPRR